jgi:hypothetical protein
MCGLDLAGREMGSQASSCNYGNETSGFTKFRQSSHQLSNYQMVKAVSVCSITHNSNYFFMRFSSCVATYLKIMMMSSDMITAVFV